MRSPESEAPQLVIVTELITGLGDESVRVEDYFAHFDWEGAAPDAELLSAEDFLVALDR